MSHLGGPDLRYPIGGLFTTLGLLLAGYGLASAGDVRNVNVWWGLVMLLFGVSLLYGASRGRGRAAPRPAMESPQGRETEERERRLGLER